MTFWALLAYVEDRRWTVALWFSLAVLAKETAILAPLALFARELVVALLVVPSEGVIPGEARGSLVSSSIQRKPRFLVASAPRIDNAMSWSGVCGQLLIPLIPLALWYAFHFARTGFVFGNPEFFRYNVQTTVQPLPRVLLALGLRLWQVVGYLNLSFLTLAGVLAMWLPALRDHGEERKRISLDVQFSFLAIIAAYVIAMAVVGGAVLARYMLPVVPLVIILWVSTLRRRVRLWRVVIVIVALAFVAALFVNPPYGFSIEDNLAYRDYILLHQQAEDYVEARYPMARVS